MSGDLVERLQALARAKHDDLSVANEAADLIEAQAGEIERLRGDLVNERRVVTTQSEARVAAESELSTLRARVREVVGPFAEIRQALELISANKPGDELLDERAIFQTWGLKDTPTSKQITLGHLRAASQLIEEVK